MTLAQQILEQHLVRPEEIGLGRVIDVDEVVLWASGNTYHKGNFLLELTSDRYVDCLRIALKVYDFLKKYHSELNPAVAGTDSLGSQQWAEITDPKEGGVIQIDASPWYARLNPGHKKAWELRENVRKQIPNLKLLTVTRELGPMLSSSKIGDLFLDTGIHIFWPTRDVEAHAYPGIGGLDLEKERERLIGRVLMFSDELLSYPEYRFILVGVLSPRPLIPERKTLRIYFDVPNAELLQGEIEGASFEDLVSSRAINFGFLDSLLGTDIPTGPYEDISSLKKRVVKDNQDQILFDGMIAELPRVMRLLRQAKPELPVYGSYGSQEKFKVAHGGRSVWKRA